MVNVNYISSVEDLQNMGKDGYYKLTKNINCDGFDFESIPEFRGTFDGDGHTIKNLKMQEYGLISVGKNVIIKNIQFDNINVEGYAGLICYLYGKCKFENIIIKNSTISGSDSVGGFVGYVHSSSTVTCSNCKFVNSKVSAGSSYVGGFVGAVASSSISFSDCDVSKSNITAGSANVGGFVGYVNSSSSSYSNCSVSNSRVRSAGSNIVGGFVGCVYSSSVIVSDSVIEKSNLAGSYNVGGFVGYVDSSSKVVSVRNSVVSGCKVSAKEEDAGSIIGFDYYKKSVISNVPVLNTTVIVGRKQITNKVGNIDIESTVRGHSHRVPSRKPAARKPTARKTTVRKPTARRTVGRVRVNYKKML